MDEPKNKPLQFLINRLTDKTAGSLSHTLENIYKYLQVTCINTNLSTYIQESEFHFHVLLIFHSHLVSNLDTAKTRTNNPRSFTFKNSKQETHGSALDKLP